MYTDLLVMVLRKDAAERLKPNRRIVETRELKVGPVYIDPINRRRK